MAMTNAQIRMIYAMSKRLGMDRDELHCMVHGLTGCDSIRALSVKQGVRVIDRLNVLAGVESEAPNRASKAQQRMILRLAEEMGWLGEPARLRGFLEAKTGVSDVKFLSIDSARRIIEALKAIQKGGRTERRTKKEG